MRRCAKPGAAAFVDATLLVLLRCTCGSGVDAFLRTHLHESTRHHYGGRTAHQQLDQSLPSGAGHPLVAPVALSTGRDLKRARVHVLHGTHGRPPDDEVLRSDLPGMGQEQSHENPRSASAWIGEVPASPVSEVVTGEEGEMEGFGWLREFGNGKMDIAGLILSTVLLMTAAAPLG